ncbi:hypothetical protein PsorP6_007341 [Peronosclerospora sorghi]|uniref:Uncharacterized protein n=1 Tax=Peronosclerospora sorghi TaxID=230839 RepID=A0ACC0W972_9STRA|nr:hypothetical protein PsorP6_007341 [Peronosclerospora sorghi]
MKLYMTLATAALALVASVHAEPCPADKQTKAYMSMTVLLQGNTLNSCSSASGYNMLYATDLPTTEQKTAMCQTPVCHELISNVKGTDPPDCDLKIPTSGATMNVYSLANDFNSSCHTLLGPGTPNTTPATTPTTPETVPGTTPTTPETVPGTTPTTPETVPGTTPTTPETAPASPPPTAPTSSTPSTEDGNTQESLDGNSPTQQAPPNAC